MACTACLVCLVSTVSGCLKMPFEEQAIVAGTYQNLSNLLFLDIYGMNKVKRFKETCKCFLYPINRHLRKIDWSVACTACLVCLVSTVSSCLKNTLWRASTSSRHRPKLKQSTFHRYLWEWTKLKGLRKHISVFPIWFIDI
jgi:hypothetical protein